MKTLRFLICALTLTVHASRAGTDRVARKSETLVIDLPAALRLAGAQNLDVQLARERVSEAQAVHESATEGFFPWITPGVAYRAHTNLTQTVQGDVIDANKQSYAPGATLNAQTDIGDALFKSLSSRQLLHASTHGFDSQKAESILDAARGYLDLVKAAGAKNVARESVRISDEYQQQIVRAVEAGVAFKGDALRVRAQTERNRLLLRQAEEQLQIAAARLTEILHLQPGITLLPHDSEPLPLSLVSVKPSAVEMIDRALASRPEMKQHASLVLAARDAKNGAVYGPLIPTLGGYAFAGGFGGGAKGGPHEFGGSEDYSATLFWRVGPGGLFDFGQIHAKQSRMRSAEITAEKVRDRIAMEVVTARARVLSLSDQVATAKRMLDDAAESYRLDMQRKAFDVGIVLETITAEQEVTRSRNDYLAIVAEYDKAQYELLRALGSLNADVSRRGASK